MSLKTSLTREQMVSAIQGGGCVQVGGQFFRRAEDLPSEAAFAVATGDPKQKAAARELLEARRKALDLELSALDEPETAAPDAPPVPVPTPPPEPLKHPARPEPKGK